MTHKYLSAVTGVLLICGLFSLKAMGQSTRPSTCEVTVTSPKTGAKAGPDVLASGRASVPSGHALWAFAHRKGLAIWWPQGGGAAAIDRSGEYAVLVSLGGPQDVGADFEILLQVVDRADSAKLDAWFKRATETGNYPGMTLPPFVSGCGVPPRVTVVKTR
jgi:hypothetical protein